MEVLYEVRGRNLLIYLPEELDHHNAKIITEQSDWYIISNKIQNIIFNYLILFFTFSTIIFRFQIIIITGT